MGTDYSDMTTPEMQERMADIRAESLKAVSEAWDEAGRAFPFGVLCIVGVGVSLVPIVFIGTPLYIVLGGAGIFSSVVFTILAHRRWWEAIKRCRHVTAEMRNITTEMRSRLTP